MQLVLATANKGKVAEMQFELADQGYEVLPQSQFNIESAIEDGLSFVENAIIKARHAAMHTGLPAIADDSGLEIDALNGAPGIYSARYANDQSHNRDYANCTRVLNELNGIDDRQARFHCVVVYLMHADDPTPLICQGSWEGLIATERKGQYGFGYDSIFYVPEFECHAAELEPNQKQQISHRAQALAQFKHAMSNKAAH